MQRMGRTCPLQSMTLALGFVSLVGSGGCLMKQHAPRPPRAKQAAADLVIINGKVWTGTEQAAKAAMPEPTAVAIRGDKIMEVGTDLSVWRHVDGHTKVIDAAGRRVIPGITDSHTHIISGGFQLVRLNLRTVKNREEFVRAIADEAKNKRSGEWVLGGRWTVESWDHPESPNRDWIDPVTGDVPVFLNRMDGHSALVNSAALKIAGIDASGPPDPKGGEIERDPHTQEPTGILKESAMSLVGRHVPQPEPAERYAEGTDAPAADYEALKRAMRHANSLGVTSVHDMCSLEHLNAFRHAEKDGTITLRITAYLSTSDWPGYVGRLTEFGLESDWVRLAGFKGYMDGSLGSRTAYMREPFTDAAPDMPYPRGQLTAFADPPEKFQTMVAMVDAHGWQIAVHAIGDMANHLLLDAYEHAIATNGRHDARHRDEHAQHLLVSDIPRFANLGVVASMQPYHKADDGRYAEKALGSERLKGSYAYRQLLDTGALLVFGSDWPVVSMNPFLGIDSAVNARTLNGKVWLPSHSLTVEEALRAYTVAPPKAIHREDRLGTLEPGKYADLVILREDPLTIPKEQLGEVAVWKTLVGGRVVYP